MTDQGERAIEELTVGCMIQTLHNGLQPIRWIGKRRVSHGELLCYPNLRPIRIRKGALAENCIPRMDLVVSPQHRILVVSRIAERMFGRKEVLIAAKKLVSLPGVEVIEDQTAVDYWHVLCGDHQIVSANGTPAETLYLGAQAHSALPLEARAEILFLFPDFGPGRMPEAAALIARGARGTKLILRQIRNKKPIISNAALFEGRDAKDHIAASRFA